MNDIVNITKCAKFSIVNGSIQLSEYASVSVFDRGFLYGDAVFETIAVYKGRLFRFNDHWSRLQRSLAAIFMKSPFDKEEDLCIICLRLIDVNELCDGVVRVAISRGLGPRGAGITNCSSSSVIVTCFHRCDLTQCDPNKASSVCEFHERRMPESRKLHVVSIRRMANSNLPLYAKTANYLSNILAYNEAVAVGADDALLLSHDGNIAECSTSNIFFVINNILVTPSVVTGALPGIMRNVVIELSHKLGLECFSDAFLKLESLSIVSEIFITNVSLGIVPISCIGDRCFCSPGRVTMRLFEEYAQMISIV